MDSKNNIQLDLFNSNTDISLHDKKGVSDSLELISIAVSLDEIVNQLRFSNLISIVNSSTIKGKERLELLKSIKGTYGDINARN
jgi:hypothetical protein|tara:strand:+ start:1298 stop:1549 length:252 start_codon:yes stop_codon:yes gene_type:complete